MTAFFSGSTASKYKILFFKHKNLTQQARLPKLPNPKPNKHAKRGWLKVKRPTFKKFLANYSGLTPRSIQKQTSSVKLAIINYKEKDVISYRSSPIDPF